MRGGRRPWPHRVMLPYACTPRTRSCPVPSTGRSHRRPRPVTAPVSPPGDRHPVVPVEVRARDRDPDAPIRGSLKDSPGAKGASESSAWTFGARVQPPLSRRESYDRDRALAGVDVGVDPVDQYARPAHGLVVALAGAQLDGVPASGRRAGRTTSFAPPATGQRGQRVLRRAGRRPRSRPGRRPASPASTCASPAGRCWPPSPRS